MGCPLPWAVTGYGKVAQCTAVLTGPWGTFGRVGFYSPGTGVFAPTSGWIPVSDMHYNGIPHGDGVLRSFATLATAYGPVQYSTKYRIITGVGTRANWGNYNEAAGQYFPGNDWWPVAW
ncbi:MAG TPA: hypothetical protein VK524_33760 [Polyangiaceae bacterium]|nr:hypothetical protein [Polyangiaceae bacterium]